MGAFTSRQNAGVEEVDIVSNHAYKYPPRSGNYFGSHFIMGGERFDTPQPEAYLFGENADLNFLGSRPTPFPYPPPQANEPTKTLKSLVNIRKESLKFVRLKDPSCVVLECSTPTVPTRDEVAVSLEVDDVPLVEDGVTPSTQADMGKPLDRFNIEFIFDCDSRCAITIHYLCTEDITSGGVVYTPRDPSMSSETYRYDRGANQHFSQPSHWFEPGRYADGQLLYHHPYTRQMSSTHQGPLHGANGLHNAPNGVHHSSGAVQGGLTNMPTYDHRDIYPIVIHCVAEEEDGVCTGGRQSHATIAVVERHSDGSYVLKALKQKLFVDGLCYLLQEIYGIENKNPSALNTTSTFTESRPEAPTSNGVTTNGVAAINAEEGGGGVGVAETVTTPDALPLRVALTEEEEEEGERVGVVTVDATAPEDDEEGEDGGSECVICMCDPRDTLILPCRHLCLCNSCADSLRYQANNCPICRAPFRALLQIRALQRIVPGTTGGVGVVTNATEGSCDNIPSGYEAVSLIEALNGPCQNRSTVVAQSHLPSITSGAGNQASPRHGDSSEGGAAEAARILNTTGERLRSGVQGRGSGGGETNGGGGDGMGEMNGRPTSEFRMSVLTSREGSGDVAEGRLIRDKSALRAASRLPSTPLPPTSTPPDSSGVPPGADAEESDTEPDSEAEKTSPLLDAATSTDPLPLGVSPMGRREGEADDHAEDGERRLRELEAWKWIMTENGDPRGSVPITYGHMGDDSELSVDMWAYTAKRSFMKSPSLLCTLVQVNLVHKFYESTAPNPPP